MGFHRLEAAIEKGNWRSIKIVKKIAMRYECCKKRYWLEDGKWQDQIIYAMNPEDIGLKWKMPK